MKKIFEWEDDYYLSNNDLYEFPNGVKLLIVHKRGILDFAADVIIKSGSFFDSSLDLPQGTAHFLEHMLCNPNTKFKNSLQQDKFKFGTVNRPEFYTNASTSKKFMSFYGWGNFKAANRILEYLFYQVRYPKERFTEFFENEKNVILAELDQNYPPEKKDSSLAYDKFFFENYHKGFSNKVIGNKKSIKQIKIKHLLKFHDSMFIASNAAIAIQTPRKLSSKQMELIQNIAESFPSKKKIVSSELPMYKNDFGYKHFKDDKVQGLFLSINLHREDDLNGEELVRSTVLSYLSRNVILYLLYNRLREDLGMVYSVDRFKFHPIWKSFFEGIKLSFDKNNFETVLEELDNITFTKYEPFLNSYRGKRWLVSEISRYVFERTVNYNSDYAANIAQDFLVHGNDRDLITPYKDYLEMARTVTPEILIEFLNNTFLTRTAKFWMVSSYKDEEVLKVLKKSKLFKRFEGIVEIKN